MALPSAGPFEKGRFFPPRSVQGRELHLQQAELEPDRPTFTFQAVPEQAPPSGTTPDPNISIIRFSALNGNCGQPRYPTVG